MNRTRQRNECPSPPGSCSHPTICESHGCAALEVLRNRKADAEAVLTVTVTGRLRWEKQEGSDLHRCYLGPFHLGSVFRFSTGWAMMTYPSIADDLFPNEAEARAALVEAVKKAIGG